MALPKPRSVPLQGPLDSIEIADLRGNLDEPAVAALAELRQRAVDGKTQEVLEGLRALRAAHPRAVGPAYVAGALRMLELADAPGALEDLEVARDLPGATALLGDALWMIGDLQSADAAYRRAGDAGGQALVLWARGRRTKAAALARRHPPDLPAAPGSDFASSMTWRCSIGGRGFTRPPRNG